MLTLNIVVYFIVILGAREIPGARFQVLVLQTFIPATNLRSHHEKRMINLWQT